MGSTQSVLRILRLYSGSNFICLASRLISSYIKALYKFLLKLLASSFLSLLYLLILLLILRLMLGNWCVVLIISEVKS
jgi:hypothetical protein